ncbi:hypothetical protein H8959_015555 [Pygathrix nigripes]
MDDNFHELLQDIQYSDSGSQKIINKTPSTVQDAKMKEGQEEEGCISLQWQRAILYNLLKVPPVINQFTQALEHQTAIQLLKLAEYRPEAKQEKKQRLLAQAKKKAVGKGDVPTKRPPSFEQELTLSLRWWRTRRLSWW